MSDDSAVENFEKFLKEFDMEALEAMKKGMALNAFYYDRGWNAAIEAAAKIADDADEIAAADIRKLKK